MTSDELPDPAELYERLTQAEESEPEEAGTGDLPDPLELFHRMRGREESELPDPEALYNKMQSELQESSTTSASESFFGRLKNKFRWGGQSTAGLDELEFDDVEQTESLTPQESVYLGNLRNELRNWSEEDEGLASGGESSEKLPTPEELFQQIREERRKKALPPLPDLEEFKRQLEEEEAARTLGGMASEESEVLGAPKPNLIALDLFEAESRKNTEEALELEAGPVPQELGGASDGAAEPSPSPLSISVEAEDLPSVPSSAPPKERTVRVNFQERVHEGETDPVQVESDTGTGTVRVEDAQPEPKRGVEDAVPELLSTGSWKQVEKKPQVSTLDKARKKSNEALNKALSRERFSRYKLAIFTRQLSVMMNAGIQLHLCLQFAAESDPELEHILGKVTRKVESGFTFSSAIAKSSRTFDNIYVGLVQSGELSGRLPRILDRLADNLEKEVAMRKRLFSMMTYPAVLLLVCALGTAGFITYVLPVLEPLFLDLGVDLPLPTRLLLLTRHLVGPATVLAIVSALFLYFSRENIADFIESKPGLDVRLSGLPLKLPIVGDLYQKILSSRILYSLATMLDVGITLDQALLRSQTTAGNAFIARRLSRARTDLADGMSVTDCFRDNGLFNQSALHLISAGEEAARLAEMFGYVAKVFEEDVEHSLAAASALLEPIIMVLMGVIVGFVTLSAALPTIHLLQNF